MKGLHLYKLVGLRRLGVLTDSFVEVGRRPNFAAFVVLLGHRQRTACCGAGRHASSDCLFLS